MKNPLLSSVVLLEPWAHQIQAEARWNGQTVVLSLDQTDLGDRFAAWMLGLVLGDRAVPLAWALEADPANLGFDHQKTLLERVRNWLPEDAKVLVLADRFYPSVELFAWLQRRVAPDRLRLKGNLTVDPGVGEITPTGKLAADHTERYLPDVRLFNPGIPTNLGIPHEAGHPEPWSIAMNEPPNRATVRDYGSRWDIELLFSDDKSRGFD